eukprot:8840891-Heterocapsa_arctica.AAC.1
MRHAPRLNAYASPPAPLGKPHSNTSDSPSEEAEPQTQTYRDTTPLSSSTVPQHTSEHPAASSQ